MRKGILAREISCNTEGLPTSCQQTRKSCHWRDCPSHYTKGSPNGHGLTICRLSSLIRLFIPLPPTYSRKERETLSFRKSPLFCMASVWYSYEPAKVRVICYRPLPKQRFSIFPPTTGTRVITSKLVAEFLSIRKRLPLKLGIACFG